jgi:NAD(P)-dependent dehydrogenase (short-subunit alcohol dehydrogenase family)
MHNAYKELKAETGYESAELWIIDLAQISSVVNFAERFEKEGSRLDILLLNAGIEPIRGQQLTADGFEPTSVIRLLYHVNMMPNHFLSAGFRSTTCALPFLLFVYFR